jgi:Flp pilus assembly protein TadG
VTSARTRYRLAQVADDSGAAPVDFVLLAGLLTLLFLMIVQLGIALHVRNVLASAAAEGARYGANADFTDHPGEAQSRTVDIITTELGGSFAKGVTAQIVAVDGQPVVEVEVKAGLPLVALWGTARTVDVQGHALQEGP